MHFKRGKNKFADAIRSFGANKPLDGMMRRVISEMYRMKDSFLVARLNPTGLKLEVRSLQFSHFHLYATFNFLSSLFTCLCRIGYLRGTRSQLNVHCWKIERNSSHMQ